MAKRNRTVFRGVFTNIEDKAHNRTRMICKIVETSDDCEFSIVTGHIERSFFKAKEPQASVKSDDAFRLMAFAFWHKEDLTPTDLALSCEEFAAMKLFAESRIYIPRPTCDGCHAEIDPDTCGCGAQIGVERCEGHSQTPMGCNCRRANAQG